MGARDQEPGPKARVLSFGLLLVFRGLESFGAPAPETAHHEPLPPPSGGAGDLVSKVISRVIMGLTPVRMLIALLITYLLSPLPSK